MRQQCEFFFFQAEDGIRDLTVTGVQTCALPISTPSRVAFVVAEPDGSGLVLAALAPRAYRFDEFVRSEEHTSELQSQSNLVCRLLLEKKKQTRYQQRRSKSKLLVD